MNNRNEIGSEEDPVYLASLEAQKNQQKAIALHYVEIMKALKRLEKLGGELDHSVTIVEVLNAFGGEVHLTLLSAVLADPGALAKGRNALVKDKVISEASGKNRKVLKLIPAE
jgi:hypothetical protein